MSTTVGEVIKNCIDCIKNQKVRVWNHPAEALEVTGIFDRVGIDLVFGLKETSEGYHGILVITEYLSKYPYAVPITSNSAAEVVEKLFGYVSLFGPPKEILSDQGREFLNKVAQHLSSWC
jgi:hypothetical protein